MNEDIKRKEEEALDAIIALIFSETLDRGCNPSILSEEDHRALEALGSDLVDRLLRKSREGGVEDGNHD